MFKRPCWPYLHRGSCCYGLGIHLQLMKADNVLMCQSLYSSLLIWGFSGNASLSYQQIMELKGERLVGLGKAPCSQPTIPQGVTYSTVHHNARFFSLSGVVSLQPYKVQGVSLSIDNCVLQMVS